MPATIDPALAFRTQIIPQYSPYVIVTSTKHGERSWKLGRDVELTDVRRTTLLLLYPQESTYSTRFPTVAPLRLLPQETVFL
jgi:hypothetical protein